MLGFTSRTLAHGSADGNAGACGSFRNDDELLVGLTTALYGNPGVKSVKCDRKIEITSLTTGKVVTATVVDACTGFCGDKDEDLILSIGAYSALQENAFDLGAFTLSASWDLLRSSQASSMSAGSGSTLALPHQARISGLAPPSRRLHPLSRNRSKRSILPLRPHQPWNSSPNRLRRSLLPRSRPNLFSHPLRLLSPGRLRLRLLSMSRHPLLLHRRAAARSTPAASLPTTSRMAWQVRSPCPFTALGSVMTQDTAARPSLKMR